jgi:hypothetical protein
VGQLSKAVLLSVVLDAILTTPNDLDAEECRLGDLDTKVDAARKCKSIKLIKVSRDTFTIADTKRQRSDFQIVPRCESCAIQILRTLTSYEYPSPGF